MMIYCWCPKLNWLTKIIIKIFLIIYRLSCIEPTCISAYFFSTHEDQQRQSKIGHWSRNQIIITYCLSFIFLRLVFAMLSYSYRPLPVVVSSWCPLARTYMSYALTCLIHSHCCSLNWFGSIKITLITINMHGEELKSSSSRDSPTPPRA